MSLQTATSTRAIAIIISRIEPTAPQEVEARLLTQLGTQDDGHFRSVVETARAHPATLPIDSGRPADLTVAQSRLVETRIECAARALNAACPLQAGEHESAPHRGGLLIAPWQHLPAGTPIVTRTTNYATVHMAWPNLRAVNNELREAPPHIVLLGGDPNPCWKWDRPIPDNANAHALYNWITANLAAIFAASGFGFLSPFLTLAGTIAFQSPTLTDVFQIATCQAQKIAKTQGINQIISALSSMNQELQDTYLPAKQQIAGKTGQARVAKMNLARDVLISIVTTNRNNLGVLSTPGLGFEGLVPYVAGASVVLSLYQELSIVDSTVATPAQSSFITSMRDFAKEAQGHVNGEVGNIRSIRSGAIVMADVTRTLQRCSTGIAPTCVDIGSKLIGATWTDQITGESSGDKFTAGSRTRDDEIPGLVDQCRNEMEGHRRAIMTELDGKLKPLLDSAATFTNVPVPPPLPA
jgi:hypothetical protein